MTKVAIYTRVSTDEQAQKGNSMSEQEERLRLYCKAMGWGEPDLFDDDGYSAGTMNRPKLTAMLEAVRKKKYQVVITTKIDRLCRNLLDLLTLIDEFDSLQCSYVSASESFDTATPAGRMVLQILGAFAEFERGRNRERVKENLVSIVQKTDKAVSRPCFGYDIIDGKYVINEDEAKIVRQMAEWMIQGEGARIVMKKVNALGIKTKQGNSFSCEAIQKLMKRETIAGMFVYNRRYMFKGKELRRPQEEWIKIENHHEPIISKQSFEKLQSVLSSRAVGHKQSGNDRWLLSGLVYCSHCGKKMIGRYRKKPSGTQYFDYICSSYMKKGECFHHFIPRGELEAIALNTLLSINADSDVEAVAIIDEPNNQSEDELQVLYRQLSRLDEKLQKQLELYEDNEISKDDFKTARNRIDIKRMELNEKIKRLEESTFQKLQSAFVDQVNEMRDELLSENRLIQKNAICQLINRITVTDGNNVDVQIRLPQFN